MNDILNLISFNIIFIEIFTTETFICISIVNHRLQLYQMKS